ncbi:hypothetical protein Nepgr_013926 [Nepenthes gracilis]|uniref:Uncharacterized protein n=1 Tax=Nepenthes gracilis TaxID=150966 RepID=A0AAD3SJQ4_NEPGR|nr:hypothetical protein Nepgr_013926 [Nepenthes gracilis]
MLLCSVSCIMLSSLSYLPNWKFSFSMTMYANIVLMDPEFFEFCNITLKEQRESERFSWSKEDYHNIIRLCQAHGLSTSRPDGVKRHFVIGLRTFLGFIHSKVQIPGILAFLEILYQPISSLSVEAQYHPSTSMSDNMEQISVTKRKKIEGEKTLNLLTLRKSK